MGVRGRFREKVCVRVVAFVPIRISNKRDNMTILESQVETLQMVRVR